MSDPILERVVQQAENTGRCQGLQLACDLLDDDLTPAQKLMLLERAAKELCREIPE